MDDDGLTKGSFWGSFPGLMSSSPFTIEILSYRVLGS